jgi:hypothetical protein
MTKFEGGNGQINFDGSVVTITRDGGLGGFSKLPTVTIPIGDVVDVLLHEPAAIIKGWIYIATVGQEQMPSASEVGKNAQAVTYGKKHKQAVAAIHDEIKGAMTR